VNVSVTNETAHHGTIQKIVDNIEQVIIGKKDEIYLSVVALLSNGHMLLEDVPGEGKTMLIRSLAVKELFPFLRLN